MTPEQIRAAWREDMDYVNESRCSDLATFLDDSGMFSTKNFVEIDAANKRAGFGPKDRVQAMLASAYVWFRFSN